MSRPSPSSEKRAHSPSTKHGSSSHQPIKGGHLSSTRPQTITANLPIASPAARTSLPSPTPTPLSTWEKSLHLSQGRCTTRQVTSGAHGISCEAAPTPAPTPAPAQHASPATRGPVMSVARVRPPLAEGLVHVKAVAQSLLARCSLGETRDAHIASDAVVRCLTTHRPMRLVAGRCDLPSVAVRPISDSP